MSKAHRSPKEKRGALVLFTPLFDITSFARDNLVNIAVTLYRPARHKSAISVNAWTCY